jgi:hypothetical protein
LLQVGARLTEPTPDAFDLPDLKRCPTRLLRSMPRVTIFRRALRVSESVTVGQSQLVEYLSLDQCES